MIKKCSCLLLLIIALAFHARAQEAIWGTWQGTGTGPNGDHFPMIFHFRTKDGRLGGVLISPMGADTLKLEHGLIRGDSLFFDISFGKLTIHHAGILTADSMVIGTRTQQGPGMTFILKRQVAGH